MGYGLVTDDRSREEGRHYTDQWRARLHGSGASDETKLWNTRRYRRRACAGTALCGSEPARESGIADTLLLNVPPSSRAGSLPHCSVPRHTGLRVRKLKKRAWGQIPKPSKG